MAKKDIIEILFGVKGGGSISGESGKRIKEQLQQIANRVNTQITVRVNQEHFKKEIDKMQKEMQKALGKLNVDVGLVNKGSNAGGGNKQQSQKKEEDPEKIAKRTFGELKKLTKESDKLQRQIYDAQRKGASETAKALEEQKSEIDDSCKKLKELKTITTEQEKELEKYEKQLKKLTDAKKNDAEASKQQSNTKTSNKLIANAYQLLARNNDLIKSSKEAREHAEALEEAINAVTKEDASDEDRAAAIEKLRDQIAKTDGQFGKLTRETDTFGKKLKEAFNHKVVEKIAYAMYAFIANALTQIYKNVVELDKALVNLQIATGGTREETAKLLKNYSRLAQQLGVTTKEVAEAADAWLRQGYSIKETDELIKASTYLSVLGQMESAEATKALTSAMKGYKMEASDVMSVVDKLTAVDLEAAVTAGGIATAMSETAVSAESAGVSMDRLIGYITTVSEVTQDGAESVGK